MGLDTAKKVIGGTVRIEHILGSGGFGKVYFAHDTKRNENVAVKIIEKRLVDAYDILPYVEREIEVMRKIKHPHVVVLLDAIETTSAYNLVMELAPNGELFDKIVDSLRFDEATARSYFQQLISAVHYCHGLNIVHRDLKAENLLLGKNNELKVCDWGLSRYTREECLRDNLVCFHSLAGSIDYQAPEILSGRGYEGSTCDMWSCGAILFFMLCGYLPFTDCSDVQTKQRILRCQYNRRNKYLSDEASDLIANLLMIDPSKRFKTTDIISHPWFQVDLDPDLFQDLELSQLSSPRGSFTSGGGSGVLMCIPSPCSGCDSVSSPTSDRKEEIHQAFAGCNVDGTGFLSPEEVRDALIKLKNGHPVSEKEVELFMSMFHLDEQGRISEEEFVIGWTKNQDMTKKYDMSRMANLFHYDLEKKYIAEVRCAFDSIDVNGTGLITAQNLKKLKLACSDAEVTDFFNALTPENNDSEKSMTFEQFVHMCSRYDIFKDHPVAQRMRRLENFFDVTDLRSGRSSVGTGFTVAGARRNILLRIRSQGPTISTTFEDAGRHGIFYGTHFRDGKKVLEVGVSLLPSVKGYTKVIAYRIKGGTNVFHEWFLELRKVLREEILRCEEDTVVKGTPELL